MKTLPQIPDLSFDDATEFQMNVWNELAKTTPGTTITYQQLARLAGSKNASRAVGSAMAANPITILVPCHRVIQTNGKLGNYSGYGGDETKKWLLELEANSAN
jgi:methylated-DNA-[protein]-cysteine S-methyltransferase